jgi:4-diphosphocytidyl-2-C-methyl-D-erythritol kinase
MDGFVIEITTMVRRPGYAVEITEVTSGVHRKGAEAARIVNLRPRLYNHPSMTVTVRSFAKINLGLRIGAARADGFHELLTVYQTIGLHDVIRVSVERGAGRGTQIEIRCADPRVPRDESNTCFRIVEKAMQSLRAKGRVVVEIEKRLPVQGGLGGASANAVATLLGLERALKKSLAATDRLRIAAEVGSDLPLFLVGGTVLGVGRGEQVYPLPDFPAMACVVVTPKVGVSTPKAFADWDRLGGQGLKPGSSEGLDAALKGRSSTVTPAVDSDSKKNPAELCYSARPGQRPGPTLAKPTPTELRSAGQPGAAVPTYSEVPKLTVSSASDRMGELGRGLSAWLSKMYSSAPSEFVARGGRAENPLLWLVRAGIENDFERVVFPEYPELSEGKSALLRSGAKYASLSGSGSTLYGLFASREAASRAAVRLGKQGWAAQATATLPRRAYWRRVFAE